MFLRFERLAAHITSAVCPKFRFIWYRVTLRLLTEYTESLLFHLTISFRVILKRRKVNTFIGHYWTLEFQLHAFSFKLKFFMQLLLIFIHLTLCFLCHLFTSL